MGIPFYFKNLITRFPDIVKKSSTLSTASKASNRCTHLYLDYNCIIHTCAAKLLAKPRPQNGPPASITPKEFQAQVIQDSLDYISVITHHVAPKKLLYIAVDGTCPRAKMQQQRKRRFMSVWRTEKIQEVRKGCHTNTYTNAHSHASNTSSDHDSSIWDSNIVTPGTDFMKEFDNALTQYVAMSNRCGQLPYTTACSNSSEFGEGEHKIFDLMTKQAQPQSQEDIQDIHVIYGLDADLIMLSMIQAINGQIMLLREVPEFNIREIRSNEAFLLLDIDYLKSTLVDECLLGDQKRVADYVMICTLIGNDFIPPLSYLKIKSDGIDIILRLYEKIAKNPCRTNPYLVVHDPSNNVYELDYSFLTELIRELSIIENTCIVEADTAYYNKRVFIDRRNVSPEHQIDNYPSLNKFPKHINVTQPNWRLSYYKYLFQYSDKDVVQKACERFSEGITWVFNYYFTKRFNCAWYYPFCYSPTCLDLYNFMVSSEDSQNTMRMLQTSESHISHNEFKMIMDEYSDMHLLMVLPPLSAKNLMPDHIAAIMSDIQLGCVHYYPKTIEISKYLKSYLWECSAILPDMDIKQVYEAYRQAIKV